MATLSLIELLKGTSDPVAAGVIEHIVTVDQLIANLPMVSVGVRDSLVYRREKALPAVSKPASGGTVTATAALEYTRATSYVRRMVIDQDIDILDAGASGGMMNARAEAIGKAAKAIARTYGDDIITGNSNWTVTINSFGGTGYTAATIVPGPGHDPRLGPGIIRYTHSGTTVAYKAPGDAEFGASATIASGVKLYSDNEDKWVTLTTSAGSASANGDFVFTLSAGDQEVDGLQRLVATSQTISSSGTNGDAIALATLDQLADLVTNKGGPKVYIMNRRTRRAVAALLRAAGGATVTEFKNEISPTGQSEAFLTYNGIPILVSDWIPLTESKGSLSTGASVYCATLGSEAGLAAIYSDASMDAEDAGELISRGPGGLTVLNLGTVQNADVKRVRVKAYWGLLNKSEKGIARASEITN
jgi:hypothetical protein